MQNSWVLLHCVCSGLQAQFKEGNKALYPCLAINGVNWLSFSGYFKPPTEGETARRRNREAEGDNKTAFWRARWTNKTRLSCLSTGRTILDRVLSYIKCFFFYIKYFNAFSFGCLFLKGIYPFALTKGSWEKNHVAVEKPKSTACIYVGLIYIR